MKCNSTGAEAAYDLCYWTKTSQSLTLAQVVENCKRHGISKMWLSPTPLSPCNEAVISILKLIITDPDLKSKIKVVKCIFYYKDLDLLADNNKAKEWVDTYITNYKSIIGHVCVGNVIGSFAFSISIFKDAMGNLKKLLDPIKLSTIVNKAILLGDSYKANTHPSTCVLTERSKEILLFLSELLGSPVPLFVRIMPYFMISSDVPIDSCILNDRAKPYMYDGDYSYSQAFDAIVDSICCALKKVDGLDEVEIHVATGWPTGPVSATYASREYAKKYFSNLVPRIGNLTPMQNKHVDIFIYSLVDEC
ncbi:hypothetical protein MRB53_014319 [Persea americana]|uniref:Uncharacterized protein n=1 Tax=Persea americana TaxID=3435 RepID=A0ACC2KB39_PERAE|nr:hypothetical protein MRB53_014319 [Persea americana]